MLQYCRKNRGKKVIDEIEMRNEWEGKMIDGTERWPTEILTHRTKQN